MNKLRKLAILVLSFLLIVSVFAFTGCGGEQLENFSNVTFEDKTVD